MSGTTRKHKVLTRRPRKTDVQKEVSAAFIFVGTLLIWLCNLVLVSLIAMAYGLLFVYGVWIVWYGTQADISTFVGIVLSVVLTAFVSAICGVVLFVFGIIFRYGRREGVRYGYKKK